MSQPVIDRSAGAARLREPLVRRKRAQRLAARRLMQARTRQALTGPQRAHDPLRRRESGPARRAASLLLVLLVAAAIHLAIVVVGSLVGGKEPPRREKIEQVVRVEVREPPPPPPPPALEKKPEPPKPEIVEKPVRPPPKAKAPPPPAEAPKGPPPRVVGISLDSTAEGGNGPAFAVGETRAGATADRAATPREAPPVAAAPPPPAPVAHNQVASRLPVAGVTYTPPKRKQAGEPPYPETLKSQGIEADVTVMVAISAEGKVTSVKIIKPAPYPEFNEASRLAALKEEFEPASRDGVPIPYTISYTYRFRLETQ
jgi:protein TonB